MAQGILLVLSEPVSEADDTAYNDWYDHIHLPEVLALSGFTSATGMGNVFVTTDFGSCA